MPAVEKPPEIAITESGETEKGDRFEGLKVVWAWAAWFERLAQNVPKNRQFSAALSGFTSVGANTTSEQTKTVSGLNTKDIVTVNKPSHQAGLGIVNARVSANNTLAITFQNTTGAGITPSSETYKINAVRV